MFQQDGAPCHTSRVNQVHLEKATPEFIMKDEWLLQYPECNPMDFAMWNFLKEKIYRRVQDNLTE